MKSSVNHTGTNKPTPFEHAVLQHAEKINHSDSPLEGSKRSLEEIHKIVAELETTQKIQQKSASW